MNNVKLVEHIISQKQSNELLSVDLFDTLLVRPIAKPDDIFKILAIRTGEFQLYAKRAQAEQKLIKQFNRSAKIHEIYEELCSEVELRDKLIEAEVNLELEILKPRKSALEWLHYLPEPSKVFVLSDTIFSSEILRLFLKSKLGLNGVCIYSSADQLCRKTDGKLFEVFLSDNQAESSSVLHLGDNQNSDVEQAIKLGIEAIHIPSSLQNYKRHRQHNKLFSKFSKTLTCAESVAVGVIKNTWHDTPRKSAYDGNIKCFGYSAYGPLLLATCVWIVRLCKQKNLRTIYCLARDGYLVDQCIREIAKNFGLDIEPKYLLASRRMSRLLGIKSEKNLLSVLGNLKGTADEKLQKLLPYFPEISPDLSDEDIMHRYANELMAIVRFQQKAYFDELEKSGLNKNSILFDIGYQGTTQKALSDFIGGPLFGAYVITFPELKDIVPNWKSTTHAYLRKERKKKSYDEFKYFHLLHEVVFSGPSGTFSGYDCNKNPVFEDNVPSSALNELHDGVKSFIDDFLASWPLSFKDIHITEDFALAHVHEHFASPQHQDDIYMFQNLNFSDSRAATEKKAFIADETSKNFGIWNEGSRFLINRNRPPSLRVRIRSYFGKIVIMVLLKLLWSDRLKRKLQRDPISFFADSKNPIIRKIRIM